LNLDFPARPLRPGPGSDAGLVLVLVGLSTAPLDGAPIVANVTGFRDDGRLRRRGIAAPLCTNSCADRDDQWGEHPALPCLQRVHECNGHSIVHWIARARRDMARKRAPFPLPICPNQSPNMQSMSDTDCKIEGIRPTSNPLHPGTTSYSSLRRGIRGE
jgi:hypothetical protein